MVREEAACHVQGVDQQKERIEKEVDDLLWMALKIGSRRKETLYNTHLTFIVSPRMYRAVETREKLYTVLAYVRH